MYGGNDTVAVSLSMISFTTDLPSGWLYDKWKLVLVLHKNHCSIGLAAQLYQYDYHLHLAIQASACMILCFTGDLYLQRM